METSYFKSDIVTLEKFNKMLALTAKGCKNRDVFGKSVYHLAKEFTSAERKEMKRFLDEINNLTVFQNFLRDNQNEFAVYLSRFAVKKKGDQKQLAEAQAPEVVETGESDDVDASVETEAKNESEEPLESFPLIEEMTFDFDRDDNLIYASVVLAGDPLAAARIINPELTLIAVEVPPESEKKEEEEEEKKEDEEKKEENEKEGEDNKRKRNEGHECEYCNPELSNKEAKHFRFGDEPEPEPKPETESVSEVFQDEAADVDVVSVAVEVETGMDTSYFTSNVLDKEQFDRMSKLVTFSCMDRNPKRFRGAEFFSGAEFWEMKRFMKSLTEVHILQSFLRDSNNSFSVYLSPIASMRENPNMPLHFTFDGAGIITSATAGNARL